MKSKPPLRRDTRTASLKFPICSASSRARSGLTKILPTAGSLFKDSKPEKGQYIILRIDNVDANLASLELIRFDPVVFPSEVGDNVKWFPVPEL